MNNPKYLIVHHTGGTERSVLEDTSRQTFRDVDEWHKQSPAVNLGHPSGLGHYIGYHYFIDKYGIVTQGRLHSDEGAHAVGYNKQSIGICLAGNFDVTLPTLMQTESLRELLKRLAKEYSIYPSNIIPHRHVASKSCYGRLLSDTWARDLLNTSSKPQPTEQDLLIIILRLRIQIAQFMVQLLSGKKTAGFHSCGNSS